MYLVKIINFYLKASKKCNKYNNYFNLYYFYIKIIKNPLKNEINEIIDKEITE